MTTNLGTFHFRNLHPQVLIGTASDRYGGWLGQIYSPDLYRGRITKRTHIIGGKSYIEEVLPVDCVQEYFEHFSVLEIDFIFYRPLLDQNGQPNQGYHLLEKYSRHFSLGNNISLLMTKGGQFSVVARGHFSVAIYTGISTANRPAASGPNRV
jgi:hypothetical protein